MRVASRWRGRLPGTLVCRTVRHDLDVGLDAVVHAVVHAVDVLLQGLQPLQALEREAVEQVEQVLRGEGGRHGRHGHVPGLGRHGAELGVDAGTGQNVNRNAFRSFDSSLAAASSPAHLKCGPRPSLGSEYGSVVGLTLAAGRLGSGSGAYRWGAPSWDAVDGSDT